MTRLCISGGYFNYNGSFKKAIYKQITQARKVLSVLTEKATMLRLPAGMVLELFETCVVAVLLYGVEILGWDWRDVKIFHSNFLRSLLKAFIFTTNCMLYGETGSYDMPTKIDVRMVNFCLKLKFGNQRKISSMMRALISNLHTEKTDIFHFKWGDTIKSTLDHTGFSSIWKAQEIDTAKFKACFSQRCKDIFQQQWHEAG